MIYNPITPDTHGHFTPLRQPFTAKTEHNTSPGISASPPPFYLFLFAFLFVCFIYLFSIYKESQEVWFRKGVIFDLSGGERLMQLTPC